MHIFDEELADRVFLSCCLLWIIAENGGDDEGAEVFGGCDVIAMIVQGYSGPQPWVGSVAERVLETSRLPLLFVRPGE